MAGAGTDDTLILQLFLSNGTTCTIPNRDLDHPGEDDFERNTYEYFKLDLRDFRAACDPFMPNLKTRAKLQGLRGWAKSPTPDWALDAIDTDEFDGQAGHRWTPVTNPCGRPEPKLPSSAPYWVNGPGTHPFFEQSVGKWYTLAFGKARCVDAVGPGSTGGDLI